jgi:CTD kinase subunit alpha
MELFDKKALFQGNSEISQLNKIFSIMGTPNIETWPSIQSLPWYSFIMPNQEYTDTFRETYQQ